jgi:hypothetical protein
MTRNKFFDIDLKALKIEPADVTSFGDKEKKVMDCLVEDDSPSKATDA